MKASCTSSLPTSLATGADISLNDWRHQRALTTIGTQSNTIPNTQAPQYVQARNSSSRAHLGGLQGHFDPPLQQGGRKAGGGHGGEPQAEVLVAGVATDGLHDAFQGGHPADCQVAVLQAHPLPLLQARQQHLLRLRSRTTFRGG